jgi:hypothetical protein
MKRFLMLGVAAALSLPMAIGCDRKAEVKRETTVSGPGGETTTTTTKKVESSGENPPPAEGQSVPKN